MRAVVVYKEHSDHAREVTQYLDDFHRQTGKEIEQVDPDTRDGAAFCQVYDIVEYPTIIALDDDGRLLQQWRGTPLPLIDEVSYYV
ncbi:hypothetical protein CR983_03785 [Candidatus Saccharibacteria bacterium]|nr:MAG: hypothetical protein CR983_03785 [Candidatus Saccharibacteria bacterium]